MRQVRLQHKVPSYGVYEPVSRHQAAAFSIVGSPTYVGGFPWFSDDDFGEVLAAGEEACGAAFFAFGCFVALLALAGAFGGGEVDGADGGDFEFRAFVLGEAEHPGEAVGFVAECVWEGVFGDGF